MKIEYFAVPDTLYIDIKVPESADSKEISTGIVLDYDSIGNLTGIEIDNAKKNANLSEIVTKSLPLKELVFS
jgi:uncharacterized protein YuzE